MDHEMEKKTCCTAVGSQEVDVCVPVTVKPFGEAGNAKTECLGKAVVVKGCDHCPGKPEGVCKFTITQKLRVEVPVIFGARVEIGDASVDCGCVESENKCEECEDKCEDKCEECKDKCEDKCEECKNKCEECECE